jgi:hypothetical protein
VPGHPTSPDSSRRGVKSQARGTGFVDALSACDSAHSPTAPRLKENHHLRDARTLLDAAAAAPEEMSMRDVAAKDDIEPQKLRAQLGALTKLTTDLQPEGTDGRE